ncbi:hypothetical protein EYF80_005063 [Liparis tanakae]|uniref:Uncharacterized protein n=1 Tax=Liparis tanakae TaxID=230148 RepID=A0A4Z2J4N0_9TELE|nr:hypothetical protein EYF80_005063 [Liparis tanakae]
MHAQVLPWVSGRSGGARRLLGLCLRLRLHLDLRLWLRRRRRRCRWRSLVLVVDVTEAPTLAVGRRLRRLRLGEGRRGRRMSIKVDAPTRRRRTLRDSAIITGYGL